MSGRAMADATHDAALRNWKVSANAVDTGSPTRPRLW